MRATRQLSQTQLAVSALRCVDLILQDVVKKHEAALASLNDNPLVLAELPPSDQAPEPDGQTNG